MKKSVAAILVATFAVVAGTAMAGTGTVKKVDGDKVTVVCKSKKSMLKAGEAVELKASVKGAAASACTVDKVEGNTVELTCEKAAVKAGAKVTVTAEKPKAEPKAEAKAEEKAAEPKAEEKAAEPK